MPIHEIAVLAFEQISPFHLAVPCLVFADPHGEFPGAPDFRLRVCAFEPGPLTTAAGFTMTTRYGLSTLKTARTIIIPSWRNTAERPPQILLDALVRAHQRGALIVGLCLGAFVLAAAGLLDGRRATTHWAAAQDFAQRYPKVQLDANVLYIEDDNILTSAGTAAGIDCCLYILRQHYGAEYANHVARRLVVPPHRQGGQAQFIEQPLPASANDSRLAALLDQIRATLQHPHTLDSLASQARMSRRTFSRHFSRLTGSTLGNWLLNERLRLAQRLLENSEQSIERVAALAGFGSVVSLRHHFRQTLGVSPTLWRQSFKGR